jgi:nickel transport protein
LVLTLVLSTAACFQALAHKVVVGAYASGNRIEGEIGFSDGSMAKNVLVEVRADDGSKLGDTHTGEDGTFNFVPTKRVVHVFHADLGGGHIAEIRLEVSDLPAELVAGEAGGTAAAATAIAAPTAAIPAAAAPVAAVAISDAQRAALAEAVRNEVKSLRREIIALKEKNDLQSILGGIGYIVGLFGAWMFFAVRRQNRRAG